MTQLIQAHHNSTQSGSILSSIFSGTLEAPSIVAPCPSGGLTAFTALPGVAALDAAPSCGDVLLKSGDSVFIAEPRRPPLPLPTRGDVTCTGEVESREPLSLAAPPECRDVRGETRPFYATESVSISQGTCKDQTCGGLINSPPSPTSTHSYYTDPSARSAPSATPA